MQRFKSILVHLSGEPTDQAVLVRAVRLARCDGSALKLVAVVEEFPWYTRLLLPQSTELHDVLVKQKQEHLETLAEELRSEGVAVNTKVLSGRIDIEVIREVLKAGHDLVMKVVKSEGAGLISSTEMHLMRNCPSPVWLVQSAQTAEPFRRILAAVDPTPAADEDDVLNLRMDVDSKDKELNAKIMALAASLAALEGAELHVLHVWNAPGEDMLRGDPRLPPGKFDEYVESVRAEAGRALDSLVSEYPESAGRRSVHLLKGIATDVIPRFVKSEHIDLIVMGTVARTGIQGFLIGNTAETVLSRVQCSVLTVKPNAFESPVTLEEK